MNTTRTISPDNLLTQCERSMRYHQARTRYFNSMHLLIQFIVFAIASASVFRLIESLLGEQTLLGLWVAVSLLALCSLVYNPAEKASLHKSLYRSFTILAGEIVATPGDPDESTLSEWNKRIHALYAEEPPVYRALLAHCDNQVTIALGADKGYFVDLLWYHRLLRNLIPFQGSAFMNRKQTSQ